MSVQAVGDIVLNSKPAVPSNVIRRTFFLKTLSIMTLAFVALTPDTYKPFIVGKISSGLAMVSQTDVPPTVTGLSMLLPTIA